MQVVICGLTIPIVLRSEKALKNDLGLFDSEKEQIELLRRMDVKIRRKTLIHECFHAFLFITGYNELLQDISPNAEEAMTRAFEQAFNDLFVFDDDVERWIRGDI